jgi:hypothetical protein
LETVMENEENVMDNEENTWDTDSFGEIEGM